MRYETAACAAMKISGRGMVFCPSVLQTSVGSCQVENFICGKTHIPLAMELSKWGLGLFLDFDHDLSILLDDINFRVGANPEFASKFLRNSHLARLAAALDLSPRLRNASPPVHAIQYAQLMALFKLPKETVALSLW
jgi:hypothetical protein